MSVQGCSRGCLERAARCPRTCASVTRELCGPGPTLPEPSLLPQGLRLPNQRSSPPHPHPVQILSEGRSSVPTSSVSLSTPGQRAGSHLQVFSTCGCWGAGAGACVCCV